MSQMIRSILIFERRGKSSMILYKDLSKKKYQERPIHIKDIEIVEKPERPVYVFKTKKDRYKYCTMVKNLVRRVPEYREYVSFLKKHMHMNKCVVFNKLPTDNPRKRYSIELHHTPFSLMEIVNTVLSKRQALGESIKPNLVAEEILELHYDGKVGLINLSVTAHELTENGRVFIPLQWIYQRYDQFVEEYEEYMDDALKSKIELLVQMSQACDSIVSDILDPEFVYVNIDGFDLPEIPEKWGKLLDNVSIENTLNKDEEL